MDENAFTDLLVKASEAHSSLDRFKLLVKLMNLLKRKVSAARPS
jgi:predicted nucleotidyltransferase